MRHTFATLMISAKENVLWVAKMMGHSDSNTTLKYYAKYVPNHNHKNGSLFLAS